MGPKLKGMTGAIGTLKFAFPGPGDKWMIKFKQQGVSAVVHKGHLKPVAGDVTVAAKSTGGNFLDDIKNGKQLKKVKAVYEVDQTVATDIDRRTHNCTVTKVRPYTDPVVAIKDATKLSNKIPKLIGTFLPEGDIYTLRVLSNNEEIERQGDELKNTTLDPMIKMMMASKMFRRVDSPNSPDSTSWHDSSGKQDDSDDGKTEVIFTKGEVVVTFGVTLAGANNDEYKATVDGMTGNFSGWNDRSNDDKKALRNDIIRAIVSKMQGKVTADLILKPWDLTELKVKDVVTIQ